MQKYWFLVVFVFYINFTSAQLINPDTITITGIVLDADSLNSLSNVHITSQKQKGAITDKYGQFKFKINKKDTLTFSYIGFKPYVFVVPDTLKVNNYVAGVILNTDTISLSEIIILPWMNKKQFKHSFINNSPDQQTVNATRNLNLASHTARTATPQMNNDMMIDMQLKQYAMDVEYRGMISPNEQLNFIGLAQLLIYYSYQQLTKEEKSRKLKEELRRYIEEQHPR